MPDDRAQILASEEERVRQRIMLLRAHIGALEMALRDPQPPGIHAAQALTSAACDLANYVARLDLLRRQHYNAWLEGARDAG